LGPLSFHHLSSSRQGARRSRRPRRCLLKGCEQWFIPCRPQSRYCSGACRDAAKRWRRSKSSQRYRSSAGGRQRRRAQHQRYRQRRRERATASAADVPAPREGQRPACPSEELVARRCARPGCYVWFSTVRGQSCQRFCSVACRLALRRVLDREARYRQRRRRWRRERMARRSQRPDTS
jgi:hypothetical protein